MPFVEKLSRMVQLDEPIVRVRLGPKTDFLYRRDMGLGGHLLALLAFIQVLAVIHNTADRGRLSGRDLDEIKPGLTGHAERVVDGDDAPLFLMLIDQWDRRDPNPLVKTK